MAENTIGPKQEEVNVEKKAYTPPTLAVYGKLTELTSAGVGTKLEQVSGQGATSKQRT